MSEVYNGAKFDRIVTADGKELEAVVRMQEAQDKKKCFLENCPLGPDILPTQIYARVYYPDTDEVETFHVACFTREFISAFSRF
jgi:hypothetical protein